MRTTGLCLSMVLVWFGLGVHAQNARPVLADTNGVIRVGTNASLLGNLNASQLTSGTIPTNRLPGQLAPLSVGDASALTGGTLLTNTLPGLLSRLSVNDGNGTLTNSAFPRYTVFTNAPSTNNYFIPTGARFVRVEIVGNGGAGASGRRGATNTVLSGGSGGGGSSYVSKIFTVENLWTNVFSFLLYAVPQGGGAVTTDNSNGTNGNAGSTLYIYNSANFLSSSNIVLRAIAGSPGTGGDSDGSAGGVAGSGGEFSGGVGGVSSSTGGAGTGAPALGIGFGAAGGGGGGGITSAGVSSDGGAGGEQRTSFAGTTIPGGNPVPLSIFAINYQPLNVNRVTGWPGAPGSGSSLTNDAPAGGNGEGWGSGGGGGGSAANGFKSGPGGAGGPGIVAFTAWRQMLQRLRIPEFDYVSRGRARDEMADVMDAVTVNDWRHRK